MSFSSFKKEQMIFENFRKFLNEAEEKQQQYSSNDFCTEFSEACEKVYSTQRANMPQIPDAEAFETELGSSAGQGLETNEPEKIPDLGKATRAYLDSSDDRGAWPRGDQVEVVGVENVAPSDLNPTQKDIYMDNALKKAKAGADPNIDWAPWNASVLVSKDGFLLDGHHRWAATIVYNAQNPEDQKKMSIEKVMMPIKQLLKVANAYTDAIGGKRHSGAGTTMEAKLRQTIKCILKEEINKREK